MVAEFSESTQGRKPWQDALLQTFPINSRPSPVRPCVPITIRSHFVSSAARKISETASPRTKRRSIWAWMSRVTCLQALKTL